MWNRSIKEFDLIIDDGLPLTKQQKLYLNSFNKLKKGGIYIIEDVSNSFLKKCLLIRKI